MNDLRNGIEEQNEEMEIDLYQLLTDLWKNLRRLWWLVLLCVVLASGGFYAYQFLFQTPMYESTATFTVATGGESEGSASFYYDKSTADQLSKTFPYILESSYFSSVLKEQLGTRSINGTITAETITNSNVVTMKVESSDPQDAYDILTAAIAVYPETAHFVLGDISFEMLSEPEVPKAPYNQYGRVRTVLMGAAGGFLVALVICGLLALFCKNVNSPDEMKKFTSIRCLARLPRVRFKARSEKKDNRVTFGNDRLSYGYKESIRILANRLVKALASGKGKVILVTSTVAGEGKSVTAVNLAHKLGADGHSVLLVDGDLRKQNDGELLGYQGRYGLEDILEAESETAVLDKVLENSRDIRDTGICFLGGSRKNRQPAPVLSNEKVRGFLEMMRRKMDYIIIDSPPCALFQDASILAEYADGILYVVKYDKLSARKIRDGLRSLGGRKTQFLGYVFNDCPESSGGYGYGRYGYGKYGYGRYGYGRYSYGKYGGYGRRKKPEKTEVSDETNTTEKKE